MCDDARCCVLRGRRRDGHGERQPPVALLPSLRSKLELQRARRAPADVRRQEGRGQVGRVEEQGHKGGALLHRGAPGRRRRRRRRRVLVKEWRGSEGGGGKVEHAPVGRHPRGERGRHAGQQRGVARQIRVQHCK